jgi:hypothetical protein
MSSSPADFLFFMPWITLIRLVSVISNRTSESFWLIMLLLVCGCSKFLSSMSLFTVSMKVLLNMVHVLFGLETISYLL